uniref:EF-hand domain-containing protein n=1 Tax=Hanusia phi TaxID=3032 RepID=A0A7S0HHU3_9CRYP|mmetsp:Transcript_19333/g.44332  ORF Transcript_19333/g.44332 Transcript_19333/m.44332 type:complete len:1438 (+) Transcript_19333:181-4494(+)
MVDRYVVQRSLDPDLAHEVADQPAFLADVRAQKGSSRMLGVNEALARMRSRRVGGAFVNPGDDVPLRTYDVVEKGFNPESTTQERFIPLGNAKFLAKEFAQVHGESEAAQEFDKYEVEARQAEQEEQERKRKLEEERERMQKELEEEMMRNEQEQNLEVQKRFESWEASFYEDSVGDEQIDEETTQKTEMLKLTLGKQHELPQKLLDDCKRPEDVENLVNYKKQFNEIDFDNSGQIDTYELGVALEKLGIKLSSEQLRALLVDGDKSDDSELDFQEFVAFLKRFESSAKDRAHQSSNRKIFSGFADAVQNMNISFVESEFGSKMVIQRKEVSPWENYMEFPDPLHWAAAKGDLLAVRQFVRGSDGAPEIEPDALNKDGKTPLHYAAIFSQLKIIEYILDPFPHGAGCMVDMSDTNFLTPLFMAVEQGRAEAVELLAKRWANILQTNLAGSTPLHAACMLGQGKVVDHLLSTSAVVSASDDRTIRITSLEKRESLFQLERSRLLARQSGDHQVVRGMQVIQDRIITGNTDGAIHMTSMTTQQSQPCNFIKGLEDVTRVFAGHTGAITCLKMQGSESTNPGKYMVSGSEDTTVRLWDANTARCIRIFQDSRPNQFPSPVVSVDLDVASDRVVHGSRLGICFVWSLSGGNMLKYFTFHQGSAINSIQLESTILLTASNDRTFRIVDLDTHKSRIYKGHDSAVTCAKCRTFRYPVLENSVSNVILSGSGTGELFLWELQTAEGVSKGPYKVFGSENPDENAHRGPVYDVQSVFYRDKCLVIASSTPDSGVKIWDFSAPDAAPLCVTHPHTDDIRHVGFYERGLDQIVESLLTCFDIDPWLGDHKLCHTAVHRAAKNGHARTMQLLLDFDPDLVLCLTADNETVLHLAVEHEARGPACVQLAIQYGVNVNALNKQGESALHRAAALGRYHAVRALSRSKALEVDIVGAEFPVGGEPVGRSSKAPAEQRLPKLVRLPLQYAASSSRWVREETSNDVAPSVRKKRVQLEFRTLRHPMGWTPLHQACAAGRSAVVKVLIDINASIGQADDMGRTALHVACVNGTSDLIGLLLDNRADVVARDLLGIQPLHYAVKVGQEGAVKMIMSKARRRLDLDSLEETDGLSALHLAAQYGLESICYVLLEGGAHVNLLDRNLCTPLHLATQGAISHAVDNSGPPTTQTGLQHAYGRRSTRKLDNWLSHWESSREIRKGLGARRLAELREEVRGSFGHFLETIQVLLDSYARYDVVDARGMTAEDVASSDPVMWPKIQRLLAQNSPDGSTFVQAHDVIKAMYLGEQGVKFEHSNVWRFTSTFRLRCEPGLPVSYGTRAFRTPKTSFDRTEADARDLGQYVIGQAGEINRQGSNLYTLGIEYMEQRSGLPKEARTLLFAWDPSKRTFQSKMNAEVLQLQVGREYEMKVLAVEEWRDVSEGYVIPSCFLTPGGNR